VNGSATETASRFAVAPMMEWTDRHCRFFLRLISRRALLYTEMVTTAAILHGDQERLLGRHETEHPVALQLGGSDPGELARCARIGAHWGYDEINLNVGCPSDRVQSGRFGACLMAEPDLVGDCVAAMRDAVEVPVTVKCRLGIDHHERYEDLLDFVDRVAARGCRRFIVHARKAWLDGLSPKENREIPPLRYDFVHRLKRDRPGLQVVINGGLNNLDECMPHLETLDGVMLGRAAYQRPYLLAEVDWRCYGDATPVRSRAEVIAALLPYVEAELARGTRLIAVTRHVLGLYHGCPGGRLFRRHLAENACRPGAGSEVLRDAADLAEQAISRHEQREAS
jgi:tRNA-dihydrouridine synthase A